MRLKANSRDTCGPFSNVKNLHLPTHSRPLHADTTWKKVTFSNQDPVVQSPIKLILG